MTKGSVGKVSTRFVEVPEGLALESGARLPSLRIAYETYGTLNRDRSNAILVCHALSGDAHAAGTSDEDGREGWWDIAIGPGKAFDTDRYFVVCSNVLGGCKGTTGPSSVNPETGKPYRIAFPVITIRDMVAAQKKLADHLGLPRLFAVAGGSMGAMQVLQWCVDYPDFVRKAVVIATSAASTAQQIAFNEVGRRAIMADPDWRGGDYYGRANPVHGLAVARMVGHITYLSDDSMHAKFGRRLQANDEPAYDFSTEFQVESYLHHQGDSFTRRFDANSYLYITKAIDYFDLAKDGSLIDGLAPLKAKVLVVGISSDWLYPPYQQQAIVSALTANERDVHYGEIRSHYGHDAFLLEGGQLNYLVGTFLSHSLVRDVMIPKVPTLREGTGVNEAARLMIEREVNHLPVLDGKGRLTGIVTSWDIAKAVACGLDRLDEIITREVVTALPDEPVEAAAHRMEAHAISALPVVDGKKKVIGLVTSDAISTLVGKCP
ncbi:MAG TPA: homoserine O-acetyltransferase [Methanomicrobiales archaeon]|nr:homoserine O-acetyltransferase [Methanomicrobiales archaeon]